MTCLHCSRGNNDPRTDDPCEKRKESTLVNSEGSPQPTTQYMSRRGWVSSNHCICRTTIDVGKNWRKRIRKETKPTTSLKRFLSSSTTSQVTHTYREHQCKKKDSKIEVNYQNKGSLKRNEVKNGSIQNHCWLYTANCIGYEQKRLSRAIKTMWKPKGLYQKREEDQTRIGPSASI